MLSKFNPEFKIEENVFVISVVSLTKRGNMDRLLFVIEGCEPESLTINLKSYYREYVVLHITEKNIMTDKMVDKITITKQPEQDYPPSIIKLKRPLTFSVSPLAAKQVAITIEDEIAIFNDAATGGCEYPVLNPGDVRYNFPEEVNKTLVAWCSGKLALAGIAPIPEPAQESKGCCAVS